MQQQISPKTGIIETAPAPVALEVCARFVVETLVVGGGVTARFLVLGAGGVAGRAWMQLVMSTIQLRTP